MKKAMKDITETARGLLRNGKALALFFVTYFALLATLPVFIFTREATIKDILVTLATLIVLPVLFFLLQAMCVTYTKTSSISDVIKESTAIFRKLVIVTLPFLAVGVAVYLLLGRIDASVSPTTLAREGETWPQVTLSAIRLVLFGVVFPIACIHIWIAVRRQDVLKVLRSIKPIMSKAFSLPSVQTYVLGFVLFGIIPYLLLNVRTPSDRAWLELSLWGTRVVLGLCLVLVGWVVTVGALRGAVVEEG